VPEKTCGEYLVKVIDCTVESENAAWGVKEKPSMESVIFNITAIYDGLQ
jgi:hypothetical protein